MVVVEFSITPLNAEQLTPFIDAAVNEIKKSGLKYEVDAMGTTVEGELDECMNVVMKAHKAVKDKGADRVLTEIRIDDRMPGVTIEEEVKEYRTSV